MPKQITYIALAFWILLSTVGIRVNQHFCGEMLQSVALFAQAKSCCEGGEKSDCCTDKSDTLQIKEDFQKVDFKYVLATVAVVPEVVKVLDFLHLIYQQQFPQIEETVCFYSPPPPDKDIPVLVQSFLL